MWFCLCFLFCVSMTYVVVISYFFFFKQKTAYEMRISDWSSDVCSSDLIHHVARQVRRRQPVLHRWRQQVVGVSVNRSKSAHALTLLRRCVILTARGKARQAASFAAYPSAVRSPSRIRKGSLIIAAIGCRLQAAIRSIRSEEHTSELQSLMRSSYAVFCLKKKKLK